MTPDKPATSFTFKLDDAQQILLMEILRSGNYTPVTMPYTQIAVDGDGCRVALYNSGKCLVQGKKAADFVSFVMEPQVLGAVRLGYEKILDAEHYQPHMGVDESGKGDFFGPLVIAAAYTDKALSEQMAKLGVRDSKTITSDKRLLEIARDLRQLLGGATAWSVSGRRLITAFILKCAVSTVFWPGDIPAPLKTCWRWFRTARVQFPTNLAASSRSCAL